MNNIPSIEDFLNREYVHIEHKTGTFVHKSDFIKSMKKYAALHVQAALKAASEVLVIVLDNMSKEAILNAYPLTNIK